MSVTAPPRPPSPSDRVTHGEFEALVEALIEEARQRAHRRRRIYMAVAATMALVGVVVFTAFDRTAKSQTASPELASPRTLAAAAGAPRIAIISEPLGVGRQAAGKLSVVNADGSGKRTLPVAGTEYSSPAWSPDGRRIAFVERKNGSLDGASNLAVLDADGSGQRVLAHRSVDPIWSPDGRRITFLRRSGQTLLAPWELFVMNADGSAPRKLAEHPARNVRRGFSYSWSPGGRQIAFVSDRDGPRLAADKPEIYVVNLDGSGLRNLTRSPAGDSDPAWSPDGRTIAFIRNYDLYVMRADGSGQRRLTRGAGHDVAPSWSPDGQQIVFERRLGQSTDGRCRTCVQASIFEVRVVDADGSGERRLTRVTPSRKGEGYGTRPRWSPDGKEIAFVSQRDGNAEIYVMNVDGSRQRNVSRNPNAHDNVFAWSPAQK